MMPDAVSHQLRARVESQFTEHPSAIGTDCLHAERRSDAVVYGVAVRSVVKPEFLQNLSDSTGGNLIQVESTANLNETFTSILDEFRHRYLLSYEPRGVDGVGWHRLEVKVKRSGVKVNARPGYLQDAMK